MIKNWLFLIPLFIATSALAQGDDPAFIDPAYKATLATPLAPNEKTVVYAYETEQKPCGTLMTEFSKPGTVSVGRGPVWNMSVQACLDAGPNQVPDEGSFHTVACENFSGANQSVIGRATFAFTCETNNGN
jgi:hypothetical protein